MKLVVLIGCFLVSFLISVILAPFVISASKKFKLSQTILHYVDAHKQKQGTPTMGGFIFISGIIISSIMFFINNFSLAIISLAVMLGYAIIGFLDDFIKIKYKQNKGLEPYQKLIGQVCLASIVSAYAYWSKLVGSVLYVPFTQITFDMGIFIIPFTVFVFLAFTNSVNLIDGLDGLATGVSITYLMAFSAILTINISFINPNLSAFINEQYNLLIVSISALGGLIAFACFNCHPAKVFMGDTGALALGGLLTSLAVFSRMQLLIPIIGIMFVLTTLSDIIQVFYYKRTKKRVFLMAPLHHHFEMKGVNENRIAVIYIVITLIIGALSILLTSVLSG